MNNNLCFFSLFFNFSIIKYSIKEINSLKDKIFNIILNKKNKNEFLYKFTQKFYENKKESLTNLIKNSSKRKCRLIIII